MKIQKTENTDDVSSGAVRAKLPGQPQIQVDEKGKLAAQLTVWAQTESGNAEQYQIVLTDGDIERLLASLASPKTADQARVVSTFMQQNLRSLARLSALGSGIALAD